MDASTSESKGGIVNPKYYVESYYDYYPGGGFEDFSKPYDSLDEAFQSINEDNCKDNTSIYIVEDNAIRFLCKVERVYHFGDDATFEMKPRESR
jgi:hypothetical protein